MDVIENLIAAHQGIREREHVLSKLVKMVENDAFFWDNAFKVSNFFEKEVRQHFDIEEQVLFPVLKTTLPQQHVWVLKELEKEHEPIRTKIAEFETIAQNHTRHPSRSSRETVVSIARIIIEMAILHARKEDDLMFPLVKQYFGADHYRELENRYFKYLNV